MKGFTAEIDEVVVQPTKIQPILVSFQNGDLKDEETSRLTCGTFKEKITEKNVVALSNGQVVYKGYRPNLDKAMTYTMLAVHNKRTGKIRLLQAERCQVAPVLDKHVDIDEEGGFTEKINMLNKQFGSKKVKRRTEQYERMKVDVESSKDQLEKTVANVEIDRTDLSSKSPTDESIDTGNFPVCNRDADIVEDVYKLHDIISEDILKLLCEKVEDSEKEGPEGKSSFYIETLKSLAKSSERTKKIAILEYIEAVRRWFNTRFGDVKKRTLQIYSHSVQVNNHIIDTYSMQGAKGRQRPNSMRDKGIVHCMILALMIYNFKLNLELFSSLWTNNRGAKKFAHIARIIGAVPIGDNKNIVVLKIPIPPPLSTVRKGSRK